MYDCADRPLSGLALLVCFYLDIKLAVCYNLQSDCVEETQLLVVSNYFAAGCASDMQDLCSMFSISNYTPCCVRPWPPSQKTSLGHHKMFAMLDVSRRAAGAATHSASGLL